MSVELVITTQPATRATSGETLAQQPVVLVTDKDGNPVEGVLVTAKLTTGADTLSGTTTVTTDANGIATFTDLVLSLPAHTDKLTFSSPGLTDSVETDGTAVS